jgi:hypothetical protein
LLLAGVEIVDYIYIKTNIGITSRALLWLYSGAVLSHLSNHDARSAFLLMEFIWGFALVQAFVVFYFFTIHATEDLICALYLQNCLRHPCSPKVVLQRAASTS